MKGRQIMVLKCHRFFIETMKMQSKNEIKPETPGVKEPQGKMALRKIRKFPQNDEVASKVLSGPGPIDQIKRSSSVKAQTINGCQVHMCRLPVLLRLSS